MKRLFTALFTALILSVLAGSLIYAQNGLPSAPAWSISSGPAAPNVVGAGSKPCNDFSNVGSLYTQTQNPANGYSGQWICLQTGATSLSTPGGFGWVQITNASGALLTSAVLTTPSIGQSTTTSPFTSFATLSNPGNLIAPTAVTDTVAEYSSQIFIPTTTTLTGACLLNGATVTSDRHIVYLANSAGTIIANSVLTGVADSGASQYQCQAFTSPVAVTGPGTYFVGTQPNGTTDTFYAYATGGAPTNYLTVKTTASSFGTLVALTPPTTFTTAVGPLMMVY
jgi:hypothetical protein